MATTTPLIRKVNKRTLEQPLVVKFRHTSVEVVIATGYQIPPQDLKNGRVSGSNAKLLNDLLHHIQGDLMQAYENLEGARTVITKDAMRAEYQRAKTKRENQRANDVLLEQVSYFQKANQIALPLDQEDKMLAQIAATRKQLEQEEAELLRQQQERVRALTDFQKLNVPASVRPKQKEVETLFRVREAKTRVLGDRSDLFVTYVDRYLGERINNHNGSTKYGYSAIQKLVNDHNPRLRIQEVTREVLYGLEDLAIKQGKANTSIENYTSKIKSILNYFQVDLNLSLSYKQYKFKLPTHDNDILYFTLEQLQDFWSHNKDNSYVTRQGRTAKKAFARIRDLMVFMCGTSLRYIDCFENFRDLIRTETDRQGNTADYIVMVPQKTRKKKITVKIPITPLVKTILVRNDYKFRRMKDSDFRTQLREYCQDIPSFQQEVTWFEYSGKKKVMVLDPVTGEKPKFWQELGAHTGRRTWINMAIQSGWLQPEIMGVTGHTDMNTLAGYYSKAKVTKGQQPLDFFERVARLESDILH